MRAFVALGAAAVFHSIVGPAAGHPLCYYDARPTDPNEVLSFCPEQDQGACCNALEESAAVAVYLAANPGGTTLSADCAAYYRQVACGPCNSFSAHLYEILGSELGPADGLVMTYNFCQELTTACAGEINFPTYGGQSYCEKHTLGSTGLATDPYWAYPLTPDKTGPFPTSGLADAFPNLPDSELPSELISMKMTPDGTQWWLPASSDVFILERDEDRPSAFEEERERRPLTVRLQIFASFLFSSVTARLSATILMSTDRQPAARHSN